MTTTPDLGIPELSQAQANPDITHNEALVLFQALSKGVIDKDTSAAPGSPTEGDSYIVASGGSGAWSGWDDHIAIFWGGSWRFVPGRDSAGTIITIGARHEGISVWVNDEDLRYFWNGSAWANVSAGVVFANTDRVLGRVSSGGGTAEEVTFTDQAQQLCDDTSFGAMRTTLDVPGLGSTNVLTAHNTFSGGVDFEGVFAQNFNRASNAANEKRWSWRLTATGVLDLVARTDASPDSGGTVAFGFSRSGATPTGISCGVGVTIGSPTGGNLGAGTLNADVSVSVDNSALTCVPIELMLTGSIDLNKWDSFVPDRVIPAQTEEVVERLPREVTEVIDGLDEHGAPVRVTRKKMVVDSIVTGTREASPERVEPRRHEAAHYFAAMLADGFDPRSPESFCERMRQGRAAPGLFTEEEAESARDLGYAMSRTALAVDCIAVAFDALLTRVKVLEAALAEKDA
jgi:hypothetical protein